MRPSSTALFVALLVAACGKTAAKAQDGEAPAKPAPEAPADPGKPQVKIDVLAKGEGREVRQGDAVLAHLIMSLADGGKPLMDDTRKKGDPLALVVGRDMQLPALDQMLAKMRQGDRWKGLVPWQLAFGENGIPGRVPPKSDLVIDAEIVGFVDVQIEVLQKGEGETPRRGESVLVHYVGTTTDGKQFDSSRERDEPFAVKVGESQVIVGWHVVLYQMRPGERVKATIPWQLAYGARGNPPTIPPKADLVFDIERLKPPEIKFETTKEGEGPTAARGEPILLVLSASLPDGKQVAGSKSRDDAVVVTIGAGRFFRDWDWDPMLLSLKVGGRAKAVIPAMLVAGPQGRPPTIPPKTDVVVEVERVLLPEVAMEFTAHGEGPLVQQGQALKVHYVGTTTDGKKFDSSRDRDEPLPLTLGAHQVIVGWEMALAKMRVGDRAKVTIPWVLAYGAAGNPPTIPPKADLVFDMEVVEAK